MIKEIDSKTIDFLRFPLTIGVVFIHFNISNGFTVKGFTYGADFPYWYHFLINMFSEVLPRVCVPLFFLFSGYLFFAGINKRSYIRKLRKRVKSLLIPYILWNAIAFLWCVKMFFPLFSSLIPNAATMKTNFTIYGLFNSWIGNLNDGFIEGAAIFDTPLWYVRSLLIMVLLAPVIWWLINKMRLFFVVFLALLWFGIVTFVASDVEYMKTHHWSYLFIEVTTALFFFTWGGILYIKNKVFKEWSRRVAC